MNKKDKVGRINFNRITEGINETNIKNSKYFLTPE